MQVHLIDSPACKDYKIMELLCPAGSLESLKAAADNGADAVYMGAGSFNARMSAKSTPSDLAEGADYCHLRGAKLYIALNTLVLDKEFPSFLELAYKAARCGADAFIVQDLGAAYVLKREFPQIPLHASTQTTVTNSYAAHAVKKLGFERVILARELTKSQIEEIHKSVDIDLEVFAHGALCQCYSGQCLLSSFLGGRSANRGECAQPCRLNYAIDNKRGHVLSPKDLCLIEYLKELSECGVNSIKIEGRLKRPEYVALAARTYRKAIDGAKLSEDDLDALKSVFCRGDFTSGKFGKSNDILYETYSGHTGLLLGKVKKVISNKNGDIIEIETSKKAASGDMLLNPKDEEKPVLINKAEKFERGLKLALNKRDIFKSGDDARLIYNKKLTEDLSVNKNIRKLPLFAEINIEVNKPAELKIYDGDNRIIKVTGEIAQKAVKKAITQNEIKAQISKTGDYPFYFEDIKINLDDDAAYSKSTLNALRRAALDEYSHILTHTDPISEPDLNLLYSVKNSAKRSVKKPKLAAYVSDCAQARAVENIVDILYIPFDLAGNRFNCPIVIPAYPPVCSDREIELVKANINEFEYALFTSLTSDGKKIADYSFNVANVYALHSLKELGYTRAMLSLELNAAQIRDITLNSPIETEVAAYGRVNLMVSANCPVNCDKKNCKLDNRNVFLKDRMNKEFPIKKIGNGCKVAILNSVPIYMADKISDICADVIRLIFTGESPSRCGEVAEIYKNALAGIKAKTPEPGSFTRGHFYRGFNKYE